MTETELDRQIAETIRGGFDEGFAQFCADTFASHGYPRENLAAARLHAFYLRVALRLLAGMDVPEGLPWMAECRSIAEQSRLSALETGRPVTEIFVEKWCSHFSSR